MKNSLLIFITVVLISCSAFGQENTIDASEFDIKGFKPFPKTDNFIDYGLLIKHILPDSAYDYWEYVRVYDDFEGKRLKYTIVASHGDSANYAAVARQAQVKYGYGLFGRECHSPLICYSFIAGVKDKGTVDIIQDLSKLKTIIGSIDKIEEVMLYAYINGYGFDSDTIIGGAYKERKNDYLLYLLDFESTPVTYKSVKAILTKSGELRVLEESIYKQTDEYYID